MSVVTTALRELIALGVDGESLICAVQRIEAALDAERKSTLEQAIEAVARRVDSQLPSYDPDEHRRALGRARQARMEERRRQKTSEPRQDASEIVSSDAPSSPIPVSPEPPSDPTLSPVPSPPKGSPSREPDDVVSPSKPPRPAKPTAEQVEAIWALQPIVNGKRRSSRPDVETALTAALRRGGVFEDIQANCRGYYRLDECLRDGGQFAMGAARLLERDRWREFAPQAEPARSAKWGADEWRAAMQIFAETGRWKDTLGPMPGQHGCRVPPPVLAEFRPALHGSIQ